MKNNNNHIFLAVSFGVSAFSESLLQLKAVEYDERGRPDKKKLKFDMGNAF